MVIIHMTHETLVSYHVCEHEITSKEMAHIDPGANGCLCGDDMVVLKGIESFVQISGLVGHCENQLTIVAAQALHGTQKNLPLLCIIKLHYLNKVKASCHAYWWCRVVLILLI
jgi:hypothetical protein